MNTLPLEKKVLVLNLLCEGSSIRATSRITGVSQPTILKLLVDAGKKANDLHDSMMVGIQSKYIQADEIWAYVAKKQRRVTREDSQDFGDQYTFVAMDEQTKLVPVYMVGKRDELTTMSFVRELATRVTSRFQLSTDSFRPYFNAVDRTFGCEIDYAMLHKKYAEVEGGEKRYSPARIISIEKIPMIGSPRRGKICTSRVERQNLTMRMRRFTRLTNAFSKKLENLKAAVAIHFFQYTVFIPRYACYGSGVDCGRLKIC